MTQFDQPRDASQQNSSESSSNISINDPPQENHTKESKPKHIPQTSSTKDNNTFEHRSSISLQHRQSRSKNSRMVPNTCSQSDTNNGHSSAYKTGNSVIEATEEASTSTKSSTQRQSKSIKKVNKQSPRVSSIKQAKNITETSNNGDNKSSQAKQMLIQSAPQRPSTSKPMTTSKVTFHQEPVPLNLAQNRNHKRRYPKSNYLNHNSFQTIYIRERYTNKQQQTDSNEGKLQKEEQTKTKQARDEFTRYQQEARRKSIALKKKIAQCDEKALYSFKPNSTFGIAPRFKCKFPVATNNPHMFVYSYFC